jgi:hypothetical protein
MTLPDGSPVRVFWGLAAHLGDVSLGGPQMDNMTHLADLLVYPDTVVAVFKKWVIPRQEDGLIIRQDKGPLRVRFGRFPPWQNSVVWVRQDSRLALVRMSPRGRRQLRVALTETGFGIEESRASLSSGLMHYKR